MFILEFIKCTVNLSKSIFRGFTNIVNLTINLLYCLPMFLYLCIHIFKCVTHHIGVFPLIGIAPLQLIVPLTVAKARQTIEQVFDLRIMLIGNGFKLRYSFFASIKTSINFLELFGIGGNVRIKSCIALVQMLFIFSCPFIKSINLRL